MSVAKTLSVNESAEIIGIHRNRIPGLVDDGKLKAVDVSTGTGCRRRLRVLRSSLAQFLGLDSEDLTTASCEDTE